MQTLSLAMIVKDEARTLERILDSARTFCDELVVVDTGSTDDTVGIAQRCGARVFHFAWVDDFSAARNFAFAQCTQDWIIWLDADDTLSEAARTGLGDLKETVLCRKDIDAVCLPYRAGRIVMSRERILRRSAGFRWTAPVHEVITVPAGRFVVQSEPVVEHAAHPDNLLRKKDRNLKILERWHESASDLRLLYLYGSELLDHGRPAQASAVFESYLARRAPTEDVGERYWVMMKLADALKAQERYQEGLRWCAEAIQLDGRRGEAYCMMGFLFYEQALWDRAWPCFVAAASLEPPATEKVALPDFYDAMPRRFLALCFERLGRPEALRKRLVDLGGIL